MKTNFLLLTIILSLCILSASAQDKRAKIIDYLNKEIWVTDNFAGQSLTLIKENKDYYIIRNYFGSGVPTVGSEKYKVVFNSEYQIAFPGMIEEMPADSMQVKNEMFLLCVEENGLSLYLNRLKVVIDEKYLQKEQQ